MSGYIEASKLITALEEQRDHEVPYLSDLVNSAMSSAFRIAIMEVEMQPIADVKEVVRGEWVKISDTMPIYHCSICKERNLFKDGHNVFSNFCPNCGADMRGNNQ